MLGIARKGESKWPINLGQLTAASPTGTRSRPRELGSQVASASATTRKLALVAGGDAPFRIFLRQEGDPAQAVSFLPGFPDAHSGGESSAAFAER